MHDGIFVFKRSTTVVVQSTSRRIRKVWFLFYESPVLCVVFSHSVLLLFAWNHTCLSPPCFCFCVPSVGDNVTLCVCKIPSVSSGNLSRIFLFSGHVLLQAVCFSCRLSLLLMNMTTQRADKNSRYEDPQKIHLNEFCWEKKFPKQLSCSCRKLKKKSYRNEVKFKTDACSLIPQMT